MDETNILDLSPEELEAKIQELEDAEKAVKAQLLTISHRKEILETDYKLEFFEPHDKQLLFFEQFDRKRRAVFAGNRFGKTTLGVIEDICWMIGYRPFFPEGHELRYAGIPEHSVKILVLALDWDIIKELFTNDGSSTDSKGKFFEWCPPNLIAKTERNSQGAICVIHTKSQTKGRIRRSSIYFDTVKSFKQDGLSHESKDWDVIHADEPIPVELWKATSRGLIDRNGSSWWLLTPLSEPWMFNEMIDNVGHPQYWSIQASMDDNPTLSEEAKDLYLRQLDPIELECRKRGVPLAFGNLVISTYDESIHLWPEKKGPPIGWESWTKPPYSYYSAYAIDTHPQTPTAVLFVTISPEGDVFFFHELWIGGIAKDRMEIIANEIKAVTRHLRVGYELLEPAAWQPNPETGRSFADTFYDNGLSVVPASKNRSHAIQETRILFASDPRFTEYPEASKANRRKIWVMPHLRVTRKELRSWYFDKENKPRDKDDHMCENIGRLTVHDNLLWHRPYNEGKIIPFGDINQVNLDKELSEINALAAY